MRRRSPLPQRDHAAHRAEWRQLAQRALAAIDDDDLDGEERRALGDLAAMARNAWIYPCPAPEGALAACLAWNTLAWSRQGSGDAAAAAAGRADPGRLRADHPDRARGARSHPRQGERGGGDLCAAPSRASGHRRMRTGGGMPTLKRARLRAWLEYVAETAIDWLDALDAETAELEDDECEEEGL